MDVRQGERQCLVPVCGFPTGTRAAETGFLRVVLNRVVGSLFYLEKTDPELVAIRRIVYWKKERERERMVSRGLRRTPSKDGSSDK